MQGRLRTTYQEPTLFVSMASVTCFSGITSYELRELRIFQTSFYLVMAVPTFALNLLILICIWRTPGLHKPSKLLLSSLALTDLLYGSIVMPIVAASNLAMLRHHYSAYCYTWLVSRELGAWFGGMSLYTLAAISVDRFLAIQIRFSYRYKVTSRIVAALLLGWLGTPFLMGTLSRSIFTKTETQNFRIRIFLITGISILLAILTLSYSLAFYYLHKITRELNSLNTEKQGNRSNFDVSGYRTTLTTMILILVVTILFYLPYGCFLMIENNSLEKKTSESLILIGEVLFSLNSTINPIMYLCRITELRASVRATLNGIFAR